jgi:hypothetical protein
MEKVVNVRQMFTKRMEAHVGLALMEWKKHQVTNEKHFDKNS